VRVQDANTLEAYVKQAELYGTDEVFETAIDHGLGLKDLRSLALRLQNLNPSWKLTIEAQRWFLLALANAGSPVGAAARVAGVTQATARLWVDTQEDEDDEPGLALRLASNRRFVDLRGIVRGWHRTA
jgi:hypothetical protein